MYNAFYELVIGERPGARIREGAAGQLLPHAAGTLRTAAADRRRRLVQGRLEFVHPGLAQGLPDRPGTAQPGRGVHQRHAVPGPVRRPLQHGHGRGDHRCEGTPHARRRFRGALRRRTAGRHDRHARIVLLIPGQAAKVTLANTNTSGDLLTVHWAAAPPSGSGITVAPASGSVSLIRGASRPHHPYRGGVLGRGPRDGHRPGQRSPPARAGPACSAPAPTSRSSIPYPSLAAAFDNVGVTEDSDPAPGNFDGYGNSFSATALADAGITPGSHGHVGRGHVHLAGRDGRRARQRRGQRADHRGVRVRQHARVPRRGGQRGGLGDGDDRLHRRKHAVVHHRVPELDRRHAGDGDALVATTSYFNRTTPGAARTPSLFAPPCHCKPGRPSPTSRSRTSAARR